MQIYFLNSLAYPYCCVMFCFIFKSAIIVYYTWGEDLTGGVTPYWVDREILFYFILWLYKDICIKSYVKNLKYIINIWIFKFKFII